MSFLNFRMVLGFASSAALAALPDSVARDRIAVLDLPQPGKSRTVHRFIHDLSRAQAEVLGFMDADVHLPQPDTLARMLAIFKTAL